MTAKPRPWTGLTPEQSTPGDFALPRPVAGAPNVVLIVLDDTGFAQLGCFGSGLETPHIDRLAANGLRYNRFHVTALCSPTRACLLTGRNPHAVGMGFLTDMPTAYPGYTARIPKSAATMPRLLRDAGYNTLAVGKWHLVPSGERSHAGPFDRWPLGFGFERYYGFLQGDTNQWTPNLVRDNHYVDPPVAPEDGYHLTEDLAGTAIRYVQDQKHAAPGRPVLSLLPPRRDARAAPCRAGMGGAVPRTLRRRMGALARRDLRAPDRARHRASGHGASGATAVGAGLGHAQ